MVRFGTFELDSSTGELRNTAANRLRIALGDSAESPRYVETLARTGYRFITPMEVVRPPATHHQPKAIGWPPRVGRRATVFAGIAVVAVLLAMATAWNGLRTVSAPGYQFRQVTFRRGQISGARFAPDGHSILYAASWDMGAAAALHDQRRQPGVAPARLRRSLPGLRSRAGELALLSIDGTMPITGGVLFRVPMNGRAAACRTERHVGRLDAERRLAIVRATSGVTQIELPAGRSIYRTSGWISSLRVSPRAIAPASSSIRSGTRSRDG